MWPFSYNFVCVGGGCHFFALTPTNNGNSDYELRGDSNENDDQFLEH